MTLLSHVASQQKWLNLGGRKAQVWTAGQECRSCVRIAQRGSKGRIFNMSPYRIKYLIYNDKNED
jgi:hypothetical protein